jgi:hypothetical protein
VKLLFLIASAFAGDPDFCEVEDGGSNAFMRNSYVEMGIGYEGAFGESSPPSGWHTRANTGQLGFVANPQDDNWSTYYGDFFTPGSPLEGWGLKINGTSYINFNEYYYDIAGSLDDPACDISVCRQNSSAVTWTGTIEDIDIEQQYAIADGELYIVVSTTLTNNGVAPITDLYWFRNVDPDNSQSVTGDYSTTNTIISQPDSTTDLASVEAVGSDGATLYLMASDSRARVTHGGFFNMDAESIWDGSSFYSVVGESATDDAAISIAIKIDSLDVGESTSFRTIYALDSSAITSATDCAEIAVIPVDTDGDSVEDDLDVCEGYDDLIDTDSDGTPDGCDVEEPADTGVSTDTGLTVDTGTSIDTGIVDSGVETDTGTIETGTTIDTAVYVDTGISYDTSVVDTSYYDTSITIDTGDSSIVIDTSVVETGIVDTGESIDTSISIDTGEVIDTSIFDTDTAIVDTAFDTDTSVIDTSIEETGDTDIPVDTSDTTDTSVVVETGDSNSTIDTGDTDQQVCYDEEEVKTYYGGWGCSTSANSGTSALALLFTAILSIFRRNKKIIVTSMVMIFTFTAKAQDLPIYNDYSIGQYNNIDALNNEDLFAKVKYSYLYNPVSYYSNIQDGTEIDSINVANLGLGYKTGFLYFTTGVPIQIIDYENYNINEVSIGPAIVYEKSNFNLIFKPSVISSLLEQHKSYGTIKGSVTWKNDKFLFGYSMQNEFRNTTQEYNLYLSSNLTNSILFAYRGFGVEGTIKSYDSFNSNIAQAGISWNKRFKNVIIDTYLLSGITNTVGTPKINAGASFVYVYNIKPKPNFALIEKEKELQKVNEQLITSIDKTKDLENEVNTLQNKVFNLENDKNNLEKEKNDLKNQVNNLENKLKEKPTFISSLSQQEQSSLSQIATLLKTKSILRVKIETQLDCNDDIAKQYIDKSSEEYRKFLIYNDVKEENIEKSEVCTPYVNNVKRVKIDLKIVELKK